MMIGMNGRPIVINNLKYDVDVCALERYASSERNWAVLDAVREVAQECGRSPAQVSALPPSTAGGGAADDDHHGLHGTLYGLRRP